MKCPCHSKKTYEECCAPFHNLIKLPTTAEQLMRSRFSAYALGKVEYIIKTTHPKHKDQLIALAQRKKQIEAFCKSTQFENLTILETEKSLPYSYVTFHAQLSQGGQDVSFTEKSRFEKLDGKWFYLDGIIR